MQEFPIQIFPAVENRKKKKAMKTKLLLVLILTFYPLTMGSTVNMQFRNLFHSSKLSYSYIVETDLNANEFSKAFCDRLKNKYNWMQIYSGTETDNTYKTLFSFYDDKEYLWFCEVNVKKIKNKTNKIFIRMKFEPPGKLNL